MKKLGILILIMLPILLGGCQNKTEIDLLVENLPAIEEISLAYQEDVIDLWETIHGMSEEEKALLLPATIEKIDNLMVQMMVLEKLAEDQVAVETFVTLFNELPSLQELTINQLDTILALGEQFLALTTDQFNLLPENVGSSFLEYEEEMLETILPAYQEREEDAFADFSSFMSVAIPSEIEDSVVLTPEYFYQDVVFDISWTSSDETIISPSGEVVRAVQNKNVILTARVRGLSSSFTYQRTVLVRGTKIVDMPDLDPNKKLTFAYFRNPAYGTNLTTRDYMKIDVLNYAFGKIINGKLNVMNLSNLEKVLELREKGVRIVIVIDGVSTDTRAAFVEAASTDAKRKQLADSIADIIELYQMDGVDLDWEYPSGTTEKNNFSLLVREIRQALDLSSRKLLLTAAVRAGGYSTHYDLPVLNQYIDYLHIMTYGMSGSSSARHQSALHTSTYATYSVERSVVMYTNGGFDRNKLVFGIPFYVKMGDVTGSPINPLGYSLSNDSAISFTSFTNTYYNKNGYVEYFDAAAKVYYSYNGTRFASYDNPASIKLKCEWAIANNVGGVMFWDYGHDSTYGTLLDAIYQEFKI